MYKPIKHYLATGGLCVFTHFLPRRGKNKRSEKGREISALTHSTGQTEAGGAPASVWQWGQTGDKRTLPEPDNRQ